MEVKMAEVKRSKVKVEENGSYEDARDRANWEFCQFQRFREEGESINKFDLRWDYVNKRPRNEPLPTPIVDGSLQEMTESAIKGIIVKKALKLEMKQEELVKELGISRGVFNKSCKDLFGLRWEELSNEQKQEVIDSFGIEAVE
jgi:hypothetical protein